MHRDISHMLEEKVLFALDIGSSKLRLISGYLNPDNTLIIQGLIEKQSQGIYNGSVSSVAQLLEQIACLIQEFQSTYRVIIGKLILGVSGCSIFSYNIQGLTSVPTGSISIFERNLAIKQAIIKIKKYHQNDFSLLHVIPQQYQTDSSAYVVDPIGMVARFLRVRLHVIGCNSILKKNMEDIMRKVSPNIIINKFVFNGNAAASAVLLESEKEIGVIHLDIGSETVNASIYNNNYQIMSFGLETGSNAITRKIAKEFSVSMYLAEILKCRCGIADPKLLPKELKNKTVSDVINDIQYSHNLRKNEDIKMERLTKVINEAICCIFEEIFLKIEHICSNYSNNLDISAGVVITGGFSKLLGIESAVKNWICYHCLKRNSIFTCTPNVRIGLPRNVKVTDYFLKKNHVVNSDKAVVIGLLRNSFSDNFEPYIGNFEAKKISFLKKCLVRLKGLFLQHHKI